MSQPVNSQGYQGIERPNSNKNEFNSASLLVESLLSKINTATLVKVSSCSNNGGLSPVGTVNVVPMVSQISPSGYTVPHGTLFSLPYFRIQGGANAVILDPEPGDIGIAVFASRDISGVVSAKAPAPPGSRRALDMADGLYLGGVLNGTPSQFIEFLQGGNGIKVTSPTTVVVTAPVVNVQAETSVTVTTPTFTVDGNTVLNGTISQGAGSSGGTNAHLIGPLYVDSDVTAGSISLETHVHGGTQPGTGTTGAPQ